MRSWRQRRETGCPLPRGIHARRSHRPGRRETRNRRVTTGYARCSGRTGEMTARCDRCQARCCGRMRTMSSASLGSCGETSPPGCSSQANGRVGGYPPRGTGLERGESEKEHKEFIERWCADIVAAEAGTWQPAFFWTSRDGGLDAAGRCGASTTTSTRSLIPCATKQRQGRWTCARPVAGACGPLMQIRVQVRLRELSFHGGALGGESERGDRSQTRQRREQ